MIDVRYIVLTSSTAALVSVLLPHTAANALPRDDVSAVKCSCMCQGGGTTGKEWTWSGTRADCKAFSGGKCTHTVGGKSQGGTLSGCDVLVVKPGTGSGRRPPTVKPGTKAQ